MQCGERPSGCEYCWIIEDIGRDSISDRVYKSKIYTDNELDVAYQSDPNQDVNLRTLEIAFDRTCNFACSYCNASFSTTWQKDIKVKFLMISIYTPLLKGRDHLENLKY